MGQLLSLWKLDTDPDDVASPYTPYTFVSINMSLDRSFERRESVLVIPSLDSVLDTLGRVPGPMDRRDLTFSFTRFTGGDNDAAYDALAAWLAPGDPVRLVYQTDQGVPWYTTGSNPRIQVTETSSGNWGRQGMVNFAVTWRIRPDWRPQFPESPDGIWGHNDGVWGVADGLWGSTAPLTSNPTTFNVDATGTAGVDLPTISDTGPIITITGPFGGDGGILLQNTTATNRDTAGTSQPTQLTLPYKLLNFNEQISLNCAAQRFTVRGVPFRPQRPTDAAGRMYQRDWFRIVAGAINLCGLFPVGANPIYGASVSSVAMTNQGSGYPTGPGAVTVTITGGGGTGATAVPVLDVSGHITSVIITNPGHNYTTAPAIGFAAASGTGATATASITAATVSVSWWRKRA